MTYPEWCRRQEKRERMVVFLVGAITGGCFVGLVILAMDVVTR